MLPRHAEDLTTWNEPYLIGNRYLLLTQSYFWPIVQQRHATKKRKVFTTDHFGSHFRCLEHIPCIESSDWQKPSQFLNPSADAWENRLHFTHGLPRPQVQVL